MLLQLLYRKRSQQERCNDCHSRLARVHFIWVTRISESTISSWTFVRVFGIQLRRRRWCKMLMLVECNRWRNIAFILHLFSLRFIDQSSQPHRNKLHWNVAQHFLPIFSNLKIGINVKRKGKKRKKRKKNPFLIIIKWLNYRTFWLPHLVCRFLIVLPMEAQ